MKEILLTDGKIAIIDDEDYALISRYKWKPEVHGKRIYAVTKSSPIKRMHRLIMKAKDGQIIDHINGDGLNNTRANLRICGISDNAKNKRKQTNNKTGFKGVSWKTDKKRFSASIGVDTKRIHVGYFDCPFKAARAYDEAAKKHHGEFANLNFPEK